MTARHQLRCPICGKATQFFAEPLGPFCSSRCKMIDLGRWLGEDYKISSPLRPDHFAESEEIAERARLDEPEDDGR